MTGQNLRGGRNHADIKRPAALRALSTFEANEKWRPYSLPLRPFNRGYLPLCYDSKTSLGSPRSSLIYEPTTVPFVILPSLYLLSPLSPSLFFHIVQASYRRVPPRHLAHASKRVHCSCTSNPALDTVSIAWRQSLLPRINLVATNLHVPQWISAHEIDDPLPQSFR